jgi:hypothetical protein
MGTGPIFISWLVGCFVGGVLTMISKRGNSRKIWRQNMEEKYGGKNG